MNKRFLFISALLQTGFLSGLHLSAQAHQDRWISMDVQHYRFDIELNDSSDVIFCSAEVEILFKSEVPDFNLDLVNLAPDGRGMEH